MYVIHKGEIIIKLVDPKGNEKELATLKEGDFFGELALLDESPRSAFAVAKTDCSLIGFFRPDLFELIKKNPNAGIKILLKLAEIIGERLRMTNKQVGQLKADVDRLTAELERLKPQSKRREKEAVK